jgi:hypothetical protein
MDVLRGTALAVGDFPVAKVVVRDRSEQFLELIHRQSRILDDPTHCVCIDGVGTGNGNDPLAIGHRDMLFLPYYPKSGFFEGLHRAAMGYAREIGHPYPATSTTREGLPFSNSSTVAR